MTSVPIFERDIFSDEFIRNPYPAYASMRQLGAVVWLPSLQNYALTRHYEVQAALRDNNTFISGNGVAADQFGCDFLQGNTVASDDARHRQLRKAMAAPMLPGALERIRTVVQKTADELIDELLTRRHFDAMCDLAQHLPLTIVRDMVGLPDFGQQRMLQWAAAAFDVLGVQNERGKQALPTIADMRTFIERDAKRENLKPGSWTRRVHELVEQELLPADLAPFAIRDYINPSLDTTISATGELIWQLAENPEQWERLKQQPDLVHNAVNEAIRLSTPIRSFSRQTSKDTQIAGHDIKRGSRVMMLFASANRDERVFNNPDQFDVTRNPRTHLGFGSGVHMCVGMHLAQLEMTALLDAMLTRVGAIRTGTPTIKLNNTIRGYATLPCTFDREHRKLNVDRPKNHAAQQRTSDVTPALVKGLIHRCQNVAKNVICLDLAPLKGHALPPYTAGAHIDVCLPNGLTRQYSLTGPVEPDRYRIAVLKTDDSRGGSQWLHQHAKVGLELDFSAPRNRFPLHDQQGSVYLFAGGIGLTPLLAMAWALHQGQRNFTLHIYVRSKENLPFGSNMTDWPFYEQVTVHEHDNHEHNKHKHLSETPAKHVTNKHPLKLNTLLSNPADASVYTCGPKGFMSQVIDEALILGVHKQRIHQEHFGAEIDPDGEAFSLVAKRSGKTLQIAAGQSILSALRKADIEVETSCENGVCGSCLTTVLEGLPDHRDLVMTDAEKSSNRKMAVCCSRSLSAQLVLDI